MPERRDGSTLAGMTLSEALKRNAELEAALATALAEITALRDKVRELEERLGQNSRNSSKPPSSDGPATSRTTRRRGKGRKRGGQPGHKGVSRMLLPKDQVDEVVVCRPDVCSECGALLMGSDPDPVRHQVTEIPPLEPVVTEYEIHSLRCLCCQAVTVGQLPEGVSASRFGHRVHALVALLTGEFRLSHREVVAALWMLFGLRLGLGTVSLIERRMRQGLDEVYEEAVRFLRAAAVAHIDETGWREAKRRAWLWVAATVEVAVYRLDRRRSHAAGRALMGEDYVGAAVTDRFGAHNGWVRRGICWSHLLRDFEAIAERFGSEWYGARMAAIARRVLAEWRDWADGTIDRATMQARIAPDKERLHRLLVNGAAHAAAPKTRRQCLELMKLEEQFWTFLDMEGMPPTNNLAERCLRSAVLWRKGSFGTDSEAGSRYMERILTVVTSRKLQGLDCLDFLVAARHAHVAGTSAPSLLPDPT